MTLTVVVLLLLVGLILIATEAFLVPGTTFVGGIGLVVLGVGVYYAFQEYGVQTGGAVLLGSALLIGLLTWAGIKRLPNSQFNVKATIDGRVNQFDYSGIEVGDEGITLTALRPEGRAMIRDERVIVYSKGFYIDTDTEVVVVKIKDNKIFVEPRPEQA